VKRGEVSNMRRYRRFTGEGLVFGIPEGTIEAFLEQRGFRQVRNVGAEFLKKTHKWFSPLPVRHLNLSPAGGGIS